MGKNNRAFEKCVSYFGDDGRLWPDFDAANTVFHECTFEGAAFENLDLSGSRFQNCVFKGIKIDGIVGNPECEFVECTFDDCDVEFIEYLQATFRSCSFKFSTKRKK